VTRGRAILAGLATGVLVAALVVAALAWLVHRREGTDGGPTAGETPAHLRPEAAPPPARHGLDLVDVTYYQRSAEGDALVPVHGRIVSLASPVDRARELVRLVLAGPPAEAVGAVRPAPPGIDYREVYLDPRGIAWVDFQPQGPWSRMGSDEETALLACLARTLVRGIPGVQRVGFLVGGETRRTLAGHVDLARTWSGDEWPVLAEDVPLPGAGDGSADGTAGALAPAGLPGAPAGGGGR